MAGHPLVGRVDEKRRARGNKPALSRNYHILRRLSMGHENLTVKLGIALLVLQGVQIAEIIIRYVWK
jgi:hypothetical protein